MKERSRRLYESSMFDIWMRSMIWLGYKQMVLIQCRVRFTSTCNWNTIFFLYNTRNSVLCIFYKNILNIPNILALHWRMTYVRVLRMKTSKWVHQFIDIYRIPMIMLWLCFCLNFQLKSNVFRNTVRFCILNKFVLSISFSLVFLNKKKFFKA